MEDKEIQHIYFILAEYHEKYLKSKGVQLPSLKKRSKGDNETYTIDGLVLVYLARNYPHTTWVSKSDLTDFIRNFFPSINDVQSARHLAMQRGFYIVSSRRGNYYPEHKPPPKGSHYLLVSLEEPHPAFYPNKRDLSGSLADYFEYIKKKYHNRCATCGSKEGKSNFRYPGSLMWLQKAHRNPKLPLQRGKPHSAVSILQSCR